MSPPAIPERNVAVFIDLENLFGGYGGAVGNVAITEVVGAIDAIVAATSPGSAIAVQRAFANWSDPRLKVYRPEMMKLGVEPVQVFSFGERVSQAADIELVVDALTRAHECPWLTVFVLVTGDGGFVPLIRRLHALNRYVIVVTTPDTVERRNSRLLGRVADAYHVVGEPVDMTEQSGETAATTDQTGATSQAGLDALGGEEVLLVALRALVSADARLRPEVDGRMNLALLGNRLRAAHPELDLARSGFRSLSEAASRALGRAVRDLATAPPGEASTARPAESPGPPGGPGVLTDQAPGTPEEYGDVLRSLLERPEMARLLEAQTSATSGISLTAFSQLLRAVAPNVSHEAVGFPKLVVALRFALDGTPYCVAAGELPTEVGVVRRDSGHPRVLPDLSSAELGSPEMLRSVLAAGKPSLRLESKEALAHVADFLARTSPRPSGTVADLLEELAARCPEVGAQALRVGLLAFVVAEVLVGDPAVPLMERPLHVAPGCAGYGAIVDRLAAAAAARLDGVGWPFETDDLGALLPSR